MIVGYLLALADSKSSMFVNDETLEKCPKCGFRTDFFAHNPRYRLPNRRYDLCATYDGQVVASAAFKRFCEQEGYGSLEFKSFRSDEAFYHLVVGEQVPFDAKRRQTRFENLCPICGNYECIIGLTPPFLDVDAELNDGIFRSDLLFACGSNKGPRLFVGKATKRKLELAELSGVTFWAAEGRE